MVKGWEGRPELAGEEATILILYFPLWVRLLGRFPDMVPLEVPEIEPIRVGLLKVPFASDSCAVNTLPST
jgi:hypothetical protein